MAKKNQDPTGKGNLPVSKQTAGGVTGAVVGGVIAGPVGAIVGGVAGALMGNRSAQGKTLVPSSTVKAAKKAVTSIGSKAVSGRAALPRANSSGKPKARQTRNKNSGQKKASIKSKGGTHPTRPAPSAPKRGVAMKGKSKKARS